MSIKIKAFLENRKIQQKKGHKRQVKEGDKGRERERVIG